jgi:DNA ligase 1
MDVAEHVSELPKDVTLDGELFSGRGTFQSTVSVVKTLNSPHWKTIVFHVFDIPSLGSKPFEERYEKLQELFGENGEYKNEYVKVVEHEEVRDREHVFERLKEVESEGGEGLMLREPGS